MRTKSSFMNVKWEMPVKTSIRLSASRAEACQVANAGMPAKPSPRKMRHETMRISRTTTRPPFRRRWTSARYASRPPSEGKPSGALLSFSSIWPKSLRKFVRNRASLPRTPPSNLSRVFCASGDSQVLAGPPPSIEESVRRHFERARHLLQRFHCGNRVAVLDAEV